MLASAKELRLHTRELLNAVEAGEEVTITFHGEPCAKLVPIVTKAQKPQQTPLFNIWNDYPIDPVEHVRKLRKNRF